jgi:ParB/RepB/Spo0J family partition protein
MKGHNMNTQTFTGQYVPPEALLANDNIRFGLKKYKVQDLANSIVEMGGIKEPLTVTRLAEPGPNGEEFLVLKGHYRHAAATLANKEGAGVLCPVIITEEGQEGLERVKLQVVENVKREDLSPMDIAVAAQRMQEAGMTKADIRALFSRAGGRKGNQVQPMSNAILNIYLSFLEFPKSIQNKIHDGFLKVRAAYILAKYAQDSGIDLKDPKVEKILADAEAERLKEVEREEKEETDFLESERKSAESVVKAAEEQKALEAAEKLAADAKAAAQAKVDEAAEKYKAVSAVPATDKDAKKAATEAFKAAEKDKQAAEKAAVEAQALADKLKEKTEKNAKLAQERREKLAKAREDAVKKSAPTEKNITNAATKADGGTVKLNGSQMRKVAEDLCLPSGSPKVQSIGQALLRCFNGETTDGQLVSELAFITGERKERPKHMPKPTTAK